MNNQYTSQEQAMNKSEAAYYGQLYFLVSSSSVGLQNYYFGLGGWSKITLHSWKTEKSKKPPTMKTTPYRKTITLNHMTVVVLVTFSAHTFLYNCLSRLLYNTHVHVLIVIIILNISRFCINQSLVI